MAERKPRLHEQAPCGYLPPTRATDRSRTCWFFVTDEAPLHRSLSGVSLSTTSRTWPPTFGGSGGDPHLESWRPSEELNLVTLIRSQGSVVRRQGLGATGGSRTRGLVRDRDAGTA